MAPKSSKGQAKPNVEKSAWKWAETTDPSQICNEHIQLAYRLNLKRCQHTMQRRNCKGNPLCLIGLGEKQWLGEIADDNWHDVEDPNDERRKDNLCVGLKNLGATCYVNSLLQVWYHNLIFRHAIYQYAETPTPIGMDSKTICSHLQLTFALLERSKRRFIDPTPFITSLGLDTMQQQDAQEFSKLFISLLEDTLSSQHNPLVRNIVKELFSGEYAYVTRCTKCQNVSQRPSQFLELDLSIKGHRNLHQCLEEFLQEEKLEGDNQYMCAHCNSKQNAGRKIALTKLPRVLNLQLLRFVFDRTTGHKKKLNTCIQFPEEIDMSQYLDDDIGESTQYELKAVLIHRGPTAYSGHYIAHIKDKTSKAWFKFNDEEVEKMKGSQLELGNEEDIDAGPPDDKAKPSKKPRLAKGTHASKNAYMLVYTKKDDDVDEPVDTIGSDIPLQVQDQVEADNVAFEEWCQEMLNMRDRNVADGKTKHEEMKCCYESLLLTNDCDYEFLSTEWLTKWLTDTEVKRKIDNTGLLCQHARLNPDLITKAKCVNTVGAEMLYTKYDGGPRLTKDALCMDCIHERCRDIRLKTKTAEDSVFISAALKNFQPDGTCYWVGKDSLKSWKKLALERQPKNLVPNGHQKDIIGPTTGASLNSTASSSPDSEPARSPKHSSVKEHSNVEQSPELKPVASRSPSKHHSMEANPGVSDCDNKTSMPEDKSMQPEKDSCVSAAVPLRDTYIESSCEQSSVIASVSKCAKSPVKTITSVGVCSPSKDSNKADVHRKCLEKEEDSELGSTKCLQAEVSCSPDADSPVVDVEKGTKTESFQFNDDILCQEHEKLSTDVSERRLVSEEVWLRLKSYFPDAPEYMETEEVCHECTTAARLEAENKETNKIIAQEQKQSLQDLYFGKNRPRLKTANTEVYAINNMFYEAWKRFIRNPSRSERPVELNNLSLCCDHHKLMFNPEMVYHFDPGNSLAVTLLTPEEWGTLRNYVTVDQEVYLLPVKQEDNSILLTSAPESCDLCIATQRSLANIARMDYKSVKIYIQKLSPESDVTSQNKNGSNSGNSSDREDPEFSENGNKKRRRTTPESESLQEDINMAKMVSNENGDIRRSSRHRKVRGEKIAIVDSDQSLRDLKVQLMKEFSVAPYDQHLILNGRELTDDKATLASLGIMPECVIKLRADEPMAGAYLIDEIPSSGPEEGFKGTGLLAGR